MSMPAIQLLRRRRPSARLVILVKAGLVPLWRLQASVDEVIEIECGLRGTWRTASAVKAGAFAEAYVFPNSFRSALIPFAARIPSRTGLAGHHRSGLLTQVVSPSADRDRVHQSWEYLRILGLETDTLDTPCLSIPLDAVEAALGKFGMLRDFSWIGIMPGAARGPTKRWPEAHFAEVGAALSRGADVRLAVFGSRSEMDLCERVCRGVGERAVNLAGRTSLVELAALLGRCRVVIANDSGGMHLAAATGVPVVAVFGMTDPSKTGPLGARHRVVTLPDVRHARDIPRRSREAEACLQAIEPGRVRDAALDLMNEGPIAGRGRPA